MQNYLKLYQPQQNKDIVSNCDTQTSNYDPKQINNNSKQQYCDMYIDLNQLLQSYKMKSIHFFPKKSFFNKGRCFICSSTELS